MAKENIPTGDDRLENISSSLSKVEQFIEKNKNIISYVVAGVILIIMGIWGYNRFIMGPKIEKAANEIYTAQYYYEMDSLDLALNGDGVYPGFLDIIDEYGGTPSGNISHYYVGMIYLKKAMFEDAIDELKKFDGNDDIIGPMATGSIADAYMELGQPEDALDYYIKAAKQSENTFTSPMYLMRAAWVHEALGQWDEAIALYEQIKTKYWKSYEAREVKKYIARATEMKNAGQ
ncbi:MAG: hypothetical protein CVU11_06535 [Bacteroidetes bacterium HGW-Bacteroidetes-6]|jgi:tetratricopeptide (TPR) repeat protein|nr:MAG: hypothetical protein CVU11_06535 [Bacteroidetes bacterium HGW-Bacteroidetes-6]